MKHSSFGDNLWHKFYHFMEQVSLLPVWMRNLKDSISNLLMLVRNFAVHFIKIYISLQNAGAEWLASLATPVDGNWNAADATK